MKKKFLVLAMAISVVALGCGKETSATNNSDTKEVVLSEEKEESQEDQKEEVTAEAQDEEISEIAQGIGYITWSDYLYEDTDNYQILLSADNTYINVITDGYDALNSSLEKYNDKEKSELIAFRDNNLEDAKETVAAMNYAFYYSNESDITVSRADTQVFSFANSVYTFLGGAHPSMYYCGVTYDSQTGAELGLKDIVTDYDKLYKVTLEKLANYEYADGFNEDYETTVKDMFYGTGEYELSPPEFWLTENGMKMMFNEYAIGPYANGSTELEILYEEYPELFNSKYVYNGVGGIQTGDMEDAVYIDVDGTKQEVRVETEVNDDEYIVNLKVSVGDNMSEFDFSGFYVRWRVLTDKNNQSYMYAECVCENDYPILEILKLDENGASKVGEIAGLSFSGYNCTDPYNMVMAERLDALGTYSGIKVYHITESGLPETNDAEYNIRMGSTGWIDGLVSTVDFAVYVNGQEEIAPAGTRFYVRGSDKESYVRAVMEDNRECEIRYTIKDGYEKMINGEISEWEAFETLPYAG